MPGTPGTAGSAGTAGTPGSLPRTGTNAGSLALDAVTLLGFGAVALKARRRLVAA